MIIFLNSVRLRILRPIANAGWRASMTDIDVICEYDRISSADERL
jgi:hypothetical protein